MDLKLKGFTFRRISHDNSNTTDTPVLFELSKTKLYTVLMLYFSQNLEVSIVLNYLFELLRFSWRDAVKHTNYFLNRMQHISLGSLGGPLCRWPCYHRWNAWGMCQEALDLERSNGEERTESKCRKDKDHDLRYRTGPPAEFRQVSMRRLSHWSEQQQHLLQRLQALGAQEMQWAQALDKRPCLQMYKVLGNCTPLGWQTTEGSPARTTSFRW